MTKTARIEDVQLSEKVVWKHHFASKHTIAAFGQIIKINRASYQVELENGETLLVDRWASPSRWLGEKGKRYNANKDLWGSFSLITADDDEDALRAEFAEQQQAAAEKKAAEQAERDRKSREEAEERARRFAEFKTIFEDTWADTPWLEDVPFKAKMLPLTATNYYGETLTTLYLVTIGRSKHWHGEWRYEAAASYLVQKSGRHVEEDEEPVGHTGYMSSGYGATELEALFGLLGRELVK